MKRGLINIELTTAVMLSNRHIHLTEEAAHILFGEQGITVKNYTNDSEAAFASNETVTLAGPKGRIENVRVLGPFRKIVQVELLASDNFKLGVEAPVRMSGNLDGAATLRIVGAVGEIEVACAIVAMRHIHTGYEDAAELGVSDGDEVSVKVGGVRGVTFDHVVIKVAKKVARDLMMHIDMEEGNAAGVQNHDRGIVIAKK